jgi:hypothetical protein
MVGGQEKVAHRQAFAEGMGRDTDRQDRAGLAVPVAVDAPQPGPGDRRRPAIGGEDVVADFQGLDGDRAPLQSGDPTSAIAASSVVPSAIVSAPSS